jgi:hypothetical protein
MLFDGAIQPVNGAMKPDRSRPGFGLELCEDVAKEYEVEA